MLYSYFTKLGKRLYYPKTGLKTHWLILKRFLIKVKIPTIPPLLVNGSFVTVFGKKASIFNYFFADQCSAINNGNVLPQISYKTNRRLLNTIYKRFM